MFLYQKKILDNINSIIEIEKENISTSVDVLINAIENKNSIYCFGASHAGIITQELYYRAGGLVVINPIFTSDTMLNELPITKTSKMEQLEGYGNIIFDSVGFKKGDILILHSVSGRNPLIIDMALKAKENGVITIAITNLTYSKYVESRHSSGKNLYQITDYLIDNHGPIGDAIVKVGDRKVGPSSTVAGTFIVNTIVTEVALRMNNSGENNIPVFYSANLDGTVEKNQKIVDYYKDIIHFDF
ncbi:MAG: SIS domain-containing protein [Helcococcus sp.]|nr:SIS domain-containing protein [Helcococcus sp.]